MKIKRNPYLVTAFIACGIFLFVFLIKGIYPFGRNSLIYGDMHDQITAFYYHMYDAFHGNASLLIDFTTSGGVNFFGIMAYYILSPFSLLLLFFPREDLYLAVSIIVSLKMIFASLTCLYSIQVLSKKKCPFLLSVILALLYAFSGYNLILYQITPWMDAMYLFPLLFVGFKKVLDGERPYLYIITLTLSIIFSFYVSYMGLILLFFLSFPYIYAFQEKKTWKKSIVRLGISTLLAIGLSMFITLPSLLQIFSSARLGFYLPSVLNSKLGPITDKISYFFPSAFLFVGVFLLLLDYKKHPKFLKWYVPSLLILGIPYIIEPVNKILHFFSYAFFPNRYGYMMIYFLILGAGYFFTTAEFSKEVKKSKLISISMTLLVCVSCIILTYLNYHRVQEALFHLTISKDKYLMFAFLFMMIVVAIGISSILFVRKKSQVYPYILAIVIVHLTCNTFLYIGLHDYQTTLLEPYKVMGEIQKHHQKGDYYRLKNNTSHLITNNGMVTGFHNLDHFTSLVDGNNLRFLKHLGYSSSWTKTFSKNGTLFADSLLANQYYFTSLDLDSEDYTLEKEMMGYRFYRLNQDLSYGYFTKNIEVDENLHTYDFQNQIYHALTSKEKDLFTIYKNFDSSNLKIEKRDGRTSYKIEDENATNYLEMDVPVKNKSIVYLEIFNSFINTDDDGINGRMRVYVNGHLLKDKYPTPACNGSLKLGEFENETVHVQIEFLYDTELSYIEVGVMNHELLDDFIKEKKVDSKVSFHRNQISVDVSSKNSGLFFIPVVYNSAYQAKVDGRKVDVKNVYGNFLGVEVDEGSHHIEFTYVTPGLKTGVMISFATLFAAVLLFRLKWYERIVSNEGFGTVLEIGYLFLYFLAIFLVYVVSILCFFLSYFFYIK